MHSTKIRTAVAAFVTALSFAAGIVAPAASQAQWHTIVVGGHVFTHGNFTEGGVSPCARIEKELDKQQQAVGDYKEWIGRKDAGKATAEAELARTEGEVNRASGEAFEYGCDVTPTPAAARSSHGQRPHRPSSPVGSSLAG